MDESIFTKLIKGEIPCHKVYENDRILAFLDIHPVNSGHTLVIPKQQIEFVWDVPDELYHELMLVTKRVAVRLREVLPFQYVHERIVGTDVPHAHVAVIPFNETYQLKREPDEKAEPDHSALAELAKKLHFN